MLYRVAGDPNWVRLGRRNGDVRWVRTVGTYPGTGTVRGYGTGVRMSQSDVLANALTWMFAKALAVWSMPQFAESLQHVPWVHFCSNFVFYPFRPFPWSLWFGFPWFHLCRFWFKPQIAVSHSSCCVTHPFGTDATCRTRTDVDLRHPTPFERYSCSCRTSRSSSLVWPYGLSCRNLKLNAAHSDHSQVACRNSVGTLWVVSISDGFSTHGSLQFILFHHLHRRRLLHRAFLPHNHPFVLRHNHARPHPMCKSVHPNPAHGPCLDLLHDPTLHLNLRRMLESMVSTSTNVGKLTRTTTTTRRSTAWPFHVPFAHLPSLKSWTSKDVTHWPFR